MIIEVEKIPNQLFLFSNEDKQYEVTLQSRNGMTYLTYRVDNELKLSNRICLDRQPIDDLFIFEDIQGTANPYYDGFNNRFILRLLE